MALNFTSKKFITLSNASIRELIHINLKQQLFRFFTVKGNFNMAEELSKYFEILFRITVNFKRGNKV